MHVNQGIDAALRSTSDRFCESFQVFQPERRVVRLDFGEETRQNGSIVERNLRTRDRRCKIPAASINGMMLATSMMAGTPSGTRFPINSWLSVLPVRATAKECMQKCPDPGELW